jgi:putative ABC transport system permease protein
MEVYDRRIRHSGKRIADLKFVLDVLLLFRPGVVNITGGYEHISGLYMLRSHFKIGWRSLTKNKGFTLINIGGLTMGMTCFAVILLYVENELSFDRFHRQPENVYRIVTDFVNNDGTIVPDATTPPALAPALREALPEVEQATRLSTGGRLYLLQYGEKRFYESNLIRVDSHFFDVFDFPFLAGSRQTALKEIHSVILTEATARKYFGDEDPIDKVIRMNLNNGTDFVVTGVLKDIPQNSHFKFDLLIPFESRRNFDLEWERHGFYTYARLVDGSDPVAFESNVRDLIIRNRPNSADHYNTQPLTDIHLTSHRKWELSANGDWWNVKIMAVIGIFVILVAATNYVNLVTSQSGKRAKEVGVRKIAGATKHLLMSQFMVESVLISLLAMAFSVVATVSVLPLLDPLLGCDLSSLVYQSTLLRIALPGTALLTGVFAGLYPAFYLSDFEPLKVLKGRFLGSKSGVQLRQNLVVFQFVISSGLIVGAFVITRQLDFLRDRDLGFNKENIILLPNVRGGIGSPTNDPGAMLDALRRIPDITHIARADGVFGTFNSANGLSTKDQQSHIVLNFVRADYEFLPALQMRLKAGRNFSEEFPSDSSGIILNVSAVEQLGLQEPYVGQQLSWDDGNGSTHPVNLIGIVEDFHFSSFRESIKPFGFILEVGNGSTFFLKTQSPNPLQTLSAIERVWNKFSPDNPFEFSFQDEQFAKFHVAESRFQHLFSLFTALAIVITCLGLFGLVAYMAETKTKEIGIRKVLGASVREIVVMLSKDFLIMALVAFAISFPLTYYVMNRWLEGFAYRNEIDWQVFMISATALTLITLATVSFQSVKAALTNPIKSLRTE